MTNGHPSISPGHIPFLLFSWLPLQERENADEEQIQIFAQVSHADEETLPGPTTSALHINVPDLRD